MISVTSSSIYLFFKSLLIQKTECYNIFKEEQVYSPWHSVTDE